MSFLTITIINNISGADAMRTIIIFLSIETYMYYNNIDVVGRQFPTNKIIPFFYEPEIDMNLYQMVQGKYSFSSF